MSYTQPSLGTSPGYMPIVLTRGYPFVADFTGIDEQDNDLPFPAGTSWVIRFVREDLGDWPALVAGALAAWDMPAAVADTIPDGAKYHLAYINGATEVPYYAGEVVRND